MSETRFRVNSPAITYETIDGEAVIINLVTGNYYSVVDSGAIIWNLVDKNATVSEIIEYMTAAYPGCGSDIERTVEELVAQLQEENLIVPLAAEEGLAFKPSDRLNMSSSGNERAAYQAPVLEKYTDMQDLLLLDPIHEVDEMGWPRAKPDPSL
jgi:coenzyme PQQ synthesis protein D (PqqD)